MDLVKTLKQIVLINLLLVTGIQVRMVTILKLVLVQPQQPERTLLKLHQLALLEHMEHLREIMI
jgi:hypothetical protein